MLPGLQQQIKCGEVIYYRNYYEYFCLKHYMHKFLKSQKQIMERFGYIIVYIILKI
jgi:hypothetical protein